MDRSKRSLEGFTVSEELVNDLLLTLEIFKEKNIKAPFVNCTINGFQTDNILQYEAPNELAQEILKTLKKDLNLIHIHLIEYFEGGEQTPHDHHRTEDYSFILYLNDSDGNTVFENYGEVKPEKGKLIFFKSDVYHWAKPSLKNKKVAVGALKNI